MKINNSLLILLFLSVLSLSCDTDDQSEACAKPSSVTINTIGFTSITIDVEATNALEYLVRYGEQGIDPIFSELSAVSSENSTIVIDQLISGETYDFYVSIFCHGGRSSEPTALLHVTTNIDNTVSCFPPINVTSNVIDYNETLVSWEASSDNEQSYEIEYGFTGFELGTGIQKPSLETQLLLDALVVGTGYDYYIRSFCDDEVSIFDGPYMFTTRACVLPSSFMISGITTTTAIASWEGNGEVSWELEYGLSGFKLGDGEVIFLGETEVEIENLITATSYDTYLRANCGPNGRSKYIGPLPFTTL